MARTESLRQVVRARPPWSAWFGVVFLLALFGVIVLAIIGPMPRGSDYEKTRAKNRIENLRTLREEADKTLTTYGWIDKNKGVARIPIAHAMELTIGDLAKQKPAPAGPAATPEPKELTSGDVAKQKPPAGPTATAGPIELTVGDVAKQEPPAGPIATPRPMELTSGDVARQKPTPAGPTATPGPHATLTQSQARGAEHLQLARIYADANRTDAALAEYVKAADANDARIREAAVSETKDLLNLRHRFFSWIDERFTLGASVILAAVGLFFAAKLIKFLVWSFRLLIGMFRRRAPSRRLEIQPLTYWPPTQASYTHFGEIVRLVREEMNDHFRLAKQVNSAQEETVLPTVFSNRILQGLEVPMSLISEKGRPIFAWIIRQINPPDLTLEGSLSSDDEAYHVVVRLVRNSKTRQTWDRTIRKTSLSDGLKDLAYSILIGFINKASK